MLWYKQWAEFAIASGETDLRCLGRDDKQAQWTAHVTTKPELTLSSRHSSKPTLPNFPLRNTKPWPRVAQAWAEDEQVCEQAEERPAESFSATRGWASAALPAQPGALAASLLSQHRLAPSLHQGQPQSERRSRGHDAETIACQGSAGSALHRSQSQQSIPPRLARTVLAEQKMWEARVSGQLRREAQLKCTASRRCIQPPWQVAPARGADAFFSVAQFKANAGWG